jgi:hypothetical protein
MFNSTQRAPSLSSHGSAPTLQTPPITTRVCCLRFPCNGQLRRLGTSPPARTRRHMSRAPRAQPRAGAEWTDDGAPRERRGLKHHGQNDTRSVPIPPELVRLLREHIARYSLAPDGRLFRSGTGGSVHDSTYASVWRGARQAGLTEEQAASPLARRPYDLRHAAISLWLNAGVPATEVARRAGHGVAVMLAVYRQLRGRGGAGGQPPHRAGPRARWPAWNTGLSPGAGLRA